MPVMSEERWHEFVSKTPRTAKVATTRADGRPHVAPVWVAFDTDWSVLFNTGASTVKGNCLRRDPRVSICFDDEVPPFAVVIIEGTASISTEPAELLRWATAIGARYMGEDNAEAFGRRNAVPGELLVRVTPTKVIAMEDMTA